MPPARFTPVVVTVLALGFVACARPPRRSSLPSGDRAMTQPTSRSVVLRSSHILLVKVVAAKPGPWMPFNPGLKSQRVQYSIAIADTHRGQIDPAPDGPVDVI